MHLLVLSLPPPWGLKGQGGGTPLQTAWTGQGECGSPDEPLGQSLLPPHPVLDGLPDRASSLCPSLAVDPTHITRSCLPHLWHQEFLFTLRRGERGYRKAAGDLVTSHSKTTRSINLPRSSGCETGFAMDAGVDQPPFLVHATVETTRETGCSSLLVSGLQRWAPGVQ